MSSLSNVLQHWCTCAYVLMAGGACVFVSVVYSVADTWITGLQLHSMVALSPVQSNLAALKACLTIPSAESLQPAVYCRRHAVLCVGDSDRPLP